MILAVDDDKNMLHLLTKQIEIMGKKLMTADTGEEGLELAETLNPELILLDIFMPGMNGFEVLKKIKNSSVAKNTPVIMLTSSSNKNDVIRAMRMGVIDYITKPYNYFDLSKKIEAALDQGAALKKSNTLAETPALTVTREAGETLIYIYSRLSDRRFLADAGKILTSAFLSMTKTDRIVLDLRAMEKFEEIDVRPFDKLLSLFAPERVQIVAGRNYGKLVSLYDLNEQTGLFISMGDLRISGSAGR